MFLIGIAGLLAAGWRALEDDLTRVAILWLAPLVGLFGFLIGFTYPYYRFFNTTLAWVLLVGLGAGFAIRFFLDRARGPGLQKLTLLGVLAIIVILGTNLTHGFAISGWTKAKSQWLEPEARHELDELRATLLSSDSDRPVVFVIDDEPPEPFQIYGFSKLSGNTSRYGLPGGQIDRGYLYLGSVDNLVEDRPTETGDPTYDELSEALLDDTQAGIEESGQSPIIVVADIFNPAGANASIASGEADIPDDTVSSLDQGSLLFVLNEQGLTGWNSGEPENVHVFTEHAAPPPWPLHLITVLLGALFLLAPGYLALRYFVPDARLADALGLVPALALGITSLVGIFVVAVYRQPFGTLSAWITLVLAIVGSFVLRTRQPRPTG